METTAGLLAMRQPRRRHGCDRDEAVRAMPHGGILRAAVARARRNGVTLGKRLEAGETQGSAARSYIVSQSTISRLDV